MSRVYEFRLARYRDYDDKSGTWSRREPNETDGMGKTVRSDANYIDGLVKRCNNVRATITIIVRRTRAVDVRVQVRLSGRFTADSAGELPKPVNRPTARTKVKRVGRTAPKGLHEKATAADPGYRTRPRPP